jgi:hypothetical protein
MSARALIPKQSSQHAADTVHHRVGFFFEHEDHETSVGHDVTKVTKKRIIAARRRRQYETD